MTKPFGIIAEFYKRKGQRLELFSLTVDAQTLDHRGAPMMERSVYNVDLSKRFGYLYDCSGFGGFGRPVTVSGPYFVRGDIKVKETPSRLFDPSDRPPHRGVKTKAIRALNKTHQLHDLPKYFRGEGNLWKWLQRNGIETKPVYCSECADHMPEDELCEHCRWCEQIHWFPTPDERCDCATLAVCSGDFSRNEEEFAFSPRHPPIREDVSWGW